MAISVKTSKQVGPHIAPDAAAVREVVKGLRRRANSDKALRGKWNRDPRSVLADAGLNRIVQNQILAEEGFAVRVRPEERLAAAACYGCSNCCCTTCSWTGKS